MVAYHYSISGSFIGGTVNISKFDAEIAGDSLITTQYTGINTSDDDLYVNFISSISGPEQTELDHLVSIHDSTPTPTEYTLFYQAVPRRTVVTSPSYITLLSFVYMGDIPIQKVTYYSANDSATGSYTIRLYDITNNTVLSETTYTNTSFQLNDASSLSNVSSSESLIEVQGKVTSTVSFTITNVAVYN